MASVAKFAERAFGYARRRVRGLIGSVDPSLAIDWRPAKSAGLRPDDSPTTAYANGLRLETTSEALVALPYSESFKSLCRYFETYPPRSLLSTASRALIYHLVAARRPKRMLEIGTYFAGTSEVIARALHETSAGVLFTIDPFGLDVCPRIIGGWPRHLQTHVRFYPLDSSIFFAKMIPDGITIDMVFIDGNHEFEFAAFDLACAARVIEPGGLIISDNCDQPGPRTAAKKFLRENPDWRSLHDPDATFPGTSLQVLQAPKSVIVSDVPRSFGSRVYEAGGEVRSVELRLDRPATGMIELTVYVRAFTDKPQEERCVQQHFRLQAKEGLTSLELASPLICATPMKRMRRFEIEAIISFLPANQGERLHLGCVPVVAPAKPLQGY